jgi:hypothetical protein
VRYAAFQKAPLAGGPSSPIGAEVDESGSIAFATDAANVYWGEHPGCLLKTAR